MRPLFVPVLAVASLLLGGCASAPNTPSLTLQTSKTPAQYADCVVPSKISADNVLEAYKAGTGGKVFIYERHLLASNLLPSSFERAAQDCI